jgi:hypothetical protein
MSWIEIILLILVLVEFVVFIYLFSRLFVYIKGLEEKVIEQVQKNENMFQSMKELVQDDFLLNDGRLKKFMYQKEKNGVYNGIRVEDQERTLD